MSDAMTLVGRTAVVTGAASGIGLGMTEALLHRGMRVVMADIESEPLEREAARLTEANLAVLPVRTDVTDEASMDALFDAAIRTFGRVHVLCNNAGVGGTPGTLWGASERDWAWVMGVNFEGVLKGIRRFIPHMIEHGEASHVVNTSSIAGLMTGGGSIYAVSKHAVTRLSEGLFFDLRDQAPHVGVTCLCPGIIDTQIVNSQRNRPAELTDPAGLADLGNRAAAIREYFKTQGMAPRQVGELVADAIIERRFYCFTQDEFAPLIRTRFDQINAGENPVLAGAPPATFKNDRGLR